MRLELVACFLLKKTSGESGSFAAVFLFLCLINSTISADHELFDPFERFCDFRGQNGTAFIFRPSLTHSHHRSIVLDMAKFVTPPVDSNALPTILALAVNDDFNDTSNTYSSSSLSSYSSGRTPRDPPRRQRIPLTISDWVSRASTDVPNHQKHQKAIEYLNYFISMGLKQGLTNDSHPIAILRDALTEIGTPDPLEMGMAIRRVAHLSLSPPGYTAQLRDFVFNDIPVFNIWDSIALIYSLAVEDVFCDREVDLFLYQLRLIFGAMRKTSIWGSDYCPSTVAASWTATGPNNHYLVAYSIACIGGQKGKLRDEQNLVRQKYNRALYSLVQKSDEELRSLDRGANRAGNCPEYSTWATICSGPGAYNSLCLSIAKERTMQCYRHSQETANAATKVGISIADCWDTCSLVSSEGKGAFNEGNYQYKQMDSLAMILAGRRGRKVQKVRRK